MEHLVVMRINHVAGCACFRHDPSEAKWSDLMNILIWLVIGGVVGWLASLIMRTDGQQGILLNVIVGIVGAFVGGLLISPLIGVGTINDGFSIASVLVSLVGAVI